MFRINCADCGKATTTETAKAMREHATSVYSFLCGNCYGTETE